MEITDIRIRKINSEGNLKAFASVSIDNVFVINDIRLIKRDNVYFLSMPAVKMSNGIFKDLVHPLNRETREMFEKAIIEKYELLCE